MRDHAVRDTVKTHRQVAPALMLSKLVSHRGTRRAKVHEHEVTRQPAQLSVTSFCDIRTDPAMYSASTRGVNTTAESIAFASVLS